ncbi:sporulation protein YqfC [Thermoclostridium stercorarium subsp. stercorarium DSM 8532]|jgi:sporulation protein YqfC|uniref:Sporulation protein YqfC n=3 Tax=Thermoclostridium stercorarium TaxID=1510 RepID=L7VLQ3_THES1|nr:sporulation protein YqfC [Thermoclostridium stercorarium]AGC67569.1 sporulation protein YqfC [Thermoclostridium stercorarium subsp. stercorarium DSM 8532]AGI38618.1 YqfC [Thermoclostridium stercorarium subsp. stercorarium DSM 8532]ANW97991.1 sporulation protein YqfC [Thermoclostridium stercorarium subsp. thermolacticum DSM 2910]ANX00541.1 sporulation protein YqfC [Thermoclostridium stercorarium subsp. leptospartum DSM 9219]
MKKRKGGKTAKKKKEADTVKEKVARMLEIPEEVVSDRPKVTTVGRKEVFIENYRGIIEFTSKIVKINSNYGIITITGKNMRIREITNEDIIITGDIDNIDYVV